MSNIDDLRLTISDWGKGSICDLRLPIADWGKGQFFNSKSAIGNRQSAMGLTLIEVMLAVVILGIGSGTLMLATARCLSVVSKARHYSTAQRLIQQVDAENPLTRGEIRDETISGDFDNGYHWEREILESDDENREGLYTVRTRVSWSTRGKERFEEVVTWHYIEPEEKDL